MSNVNLEITSGLPFSKEFSVALPVGRAWWTQLSQFEVLAQIREEKKRDSLLIKDLTEYLVVTMSDSNTVDIVLTMTGAQTRTLDRGGFYDMIISDVGTTDARAYILVQGQAKRSTVITAEIEDAV